MDIKVNGANELIRKFRRYTNSLEARIEEFLDKLANIGYEEAELRFDNAVYDGVNDVQMMIEFRGSTVNLIANGTSVLFIEFGSGIVFTEESPYTADLGFIRGTYGQGKGSHLNWTYVGEPGTNGSIIRTTKDDEYVVRTKGNPPANAMYNAARDMCQCITATAEEVFRFD